MKVRTLSGPTSYRAFGRGFKVEGLGGSGGFGGFNPTLYVPFNDAGGGVVDTSVYIGDTSAAFSRSSTAWTRLASGNWFEVAGGLPRSYYGPDGTYRGCMIELGRTNRSLWSRDLTNGAWVATTTTPLKNVTGIDGQANSASRLTCDTGGGTLFQTIVNASAARTFSCWMKRITGTGTVSITLDGGSTSTNVTGLINSTTWTLVQMTQTLANPVVGFIMATAGDVIAIDMCQEETGAFATTPYPATTVAVTRNADALTYATGAWLSQLEGSISYAGTAALKIGNGNPAISLEDGTTNERYSVFGNTSPNPAFLVADGGVTQANIAVAGVTVAADVEFRVAAAYAVNDFAIYANGIAGSTDTSGTLPTVDRMKVGYAGSSGNGFTSIVRNLRYFNRRIPNTILQALTV